MDGRNPVSFCDLPDSILILILSLLPYQEAAKTSILSKKWKTIWLTFLSTVKIDLNENNFTEEANTQFIDFARHSISSSQHRNLCEFHLKMSNPSDHRQDVQNWVQFAINKTVEVLDLDFSRHDNTADFELPGFLYEFISLRVMKLTSCNLMRLQVSNFNALKILFVGFARISTGSLKILVGGCPVLERLSLEKCSELEGIAIEFPVGEQLRKFTINECEPLIDGVSINGARNLESFKYSGSMRTFDLHGLDSLEDAHLDFGVESEFDYAGNTLCRLLEDLYRAKVLSVCTYTVQVIHSGDEPLQIRPGILDVRHLILNIGLHRDELPGISFMLRSCDVINMLSIEMGNIITLEGYECPRRVVLDGKSFWKLEEIVPFDCLEWHLKRVNMNNFRATENAMAMVEFLLANGRTLEELDIVTSKEIQMNSEETRLIIGRLGQFRRASPTVRVFFS